MSSHSTSKGKHKGKSKGESRAKKSGSQQQTQCIGPQSNQGGDDPSLASQAYGYSALDDSPHVTSEAGVQQHFFQQDSILDSTQFAQSPVHRYHSGLTSSFSDASYQSNYEYPQAINENDVVDNCIRPSSGYQEADLAAGLSNYQWSNQYASLSTVATPGSLDDYQDRTDAQHVYGVSHVHDVGTDDYQDRTDAQHVYRVTHVHDVGADDLAATLLATELHDSSHDHTQGRQKLPQTPEQAQTGQSWGAHYQGRADDDSEEQLRHGSLYDQQSERELSQTPEQSQTGQRWGKHSQAGADGSSEGVDTPPGDYDPRDVASSPMSHYTAVTTPGPSEYVSKSFESNFKILFQGKSAGGTLTPAIGLWDSGDQLGRMVSWGLLKRLGYRKRDLSGDRRQFFPVGSRTAIWTEGTVYMTYQNDDGCFGDTFHVVEYLLHGYDVLFPTGDVGDSRGIPVVASAILPKDDPKDEELRTIEQRRRQQQEEEAEEEIRRQARREAERLKREAKRKARR